MMVMPTAKDFLIDFLKWPLRALRNAFLSLAAGCTYLGEVIISEWEPFDVNNKVEVRCIDTIDTAAFHRGLAHCRKTVKRVFGRRSPFDRFWKILILSMWSNLFGRRRFFMWDWWRLKFTGKASYPPKSPKVFSYSAMAIEAERKQHAALQQYLEPARKRLIAWFLKRIDTNPAKDKLHNL